MTSVRCLRSSTDKRTFVDGLGHPVAAANSAVPPTLAAIVTDPEGAIYAAGPLVVGTQPLSWDSCHFGFPIGRIVPYWTGKSGPQSVTDYFREVIMSGAVKDWQLVYCRVPADAWGIIHALEATGYRLMDQLVTFRIPTVAGDANLLAEIRPIGLHEEALLEAVSAIGGEAFRHSRFYNDPRLVPERVGEMFASWSRSGLQGGHLFGSEVDGRLAGYVACRRLGDTVHIELIAVAPWARGRGVGRSLVRFVQYHYASDCSAVVVGTQLTNSGAVALYSRCGMMLTATELSFHLWTR